MDGLPSALKMNYSPNVTGPIPLLKQLTGSNRPAHPGPINFSRPPVVTTDDESSMASTPSPHTPSSKLFDRSGRGIAATDLSSPASSFASLLPRPVLPVEPEQLLEEVYSSPFISELVAMGVRYIKYSSLKTSGELGSGHYSTVYLADWAAENRKVAIRIPTMKEHNVEDVKKDLMREILTMNTLDHPHVVQLLGISDTKHYLDYIRVIPVVIMEFVEGGCLRTFLNNFKRTAVPDMYSKKKTDFLLYGKQIAEGMSYLAQSKIVHRNLAARNVLMVTNDQIKISDFRWARKQLEDSDYYKFEGISEDLPIYWYAPLEDSDYYKFEGISEDLPIYWYAPECLSSFKFTTKGDVWSYGVTLWEMFTLGDNPNAHLGPIVRQAHSAQMAFQVLVDVFSRQNFRLPGLSCEKRVYNTIITKCWELDPQKRPSFDTLAKEMGDLYDMVVRVKTNTGGVAPPVQQGARELATARILARFVSPGEPFPPQQRHLATPPKSETRSPSTSPEDKEIEPDKFIQEIEEAMSRNETISRKLAHGMFVGPTGTGKSSLMDRLLGKTRKQFSPSTGVSESVVVVNVGIDNPSTFHSVIVESDVWKEEDYNVSLVRQMEEGVNTSQPKDAFAIQMEEGVLNYQPKDGASSLPPIVAIQSLANREFPPPTESAQLSAPVPVSLSSPLNLPQVSDILMAKLTTTPIKKPPMKEVIRFIILKHGGYKKFKRYLKKTFSLYLRDTGGQVEFQEMLPLLIFGPSIFFFVFRLDLDFRKKFTVEYRMRPGESLNCYTSSITTEEAFLQCLASVYAMDMPGMAGIKTHKPLVFIIGTHKDKLGPLADEKIANLNQYLSVLVKNSGFDDLVLSADRDKDQIMFTVDNTSESDEDFKPIRSMVSSLVSGRQEFAIDYPISYLLFCLELQNVKRGVVSLDECKVIAAKYGIEGDQILHLLQFLHLRIGVIRYFDKDGVRHIVIKEPQILFNKVTSLIIKTFSCKALTKKEADDFEKKGILTESAFASIVSGDGNITPEEFLRLLVHLRVIALFTSPENRDKEKRYFVPSVLNHIAEFCEEDPKTDILPLAVKFKCEHCPKGLFGVVVTHLMAPDLNKGATSITTFTLMQDKIFKNQVSFEVHSPGVQDEMALLVHPSHLEIKFFPEDAEHSEDRDTSIAEVCNEVRQILETSICSALQDLHYNISNVEPMTCISCEKCSDLHQVKKGKKSWKIHCKKIKRSVCVASHGRCWFNEDSDGEVSSHATANKPVTFPPPLTHVAVKKFLKPLTNVEIRSVGLELGLRHPRLKNMREDTLLDDMLDSWLREDDDVSETSGTPSWESLVKALEEADYNGVAANIRKENL